MFSVSQQYLKSDIDFFIEQNSYKPTSRPEPLISKYIERKRLMPEGTPFPGLWRNEKTPYLIEFMDNMSPASYVQHQAWMKAAQIGVTAAAENVIAYYMDENPSEILYITATEPLLKKWVGKRLEPLIESCKIKISAQTLKIGKNKRSGDTMVTKEYPGGALDMASAQAPASQRSDSKLLLVRDEIDAAPEFLHTGEGKWLEVSKARTKAFGNRKKITDLSTPQIDGQSAIQKQYELGDQRKFLVPCPICGKYQELVWGTSQRQHGLHYETKAGKLAEVFYVCEHCHDIFRNAHKSIFLKKGIWTPTAESYSKTYRSYHISSLYSPIGMYSWFDMCQEYLIAKSEPDGMRSWVNLALGKPYKEIGSRPKIENVIELRSGYSEGTVPDGPLFLTMSVDVQEGSKKDANKPTRLELEVCGHGSRFRTWSITYQVLKGKIDDPSDGAWAKLTELQMSGGLTFRRSDGREFAPVLVFVDSGQGKFTDIVYRFCAGWANTFPCKGRREIQRQANKFKGKEDLGDELKDDNFRRYMATAMSEDVTLYNISTNFYKTWIYNNLKIPKMEDGPERSGFCAFPKDYKEKYFRMLTAEEKRRDGSFHAMGRANESLDLRVYNLAACDAYLDARVKELKQWARQNGATPMEINQINHTKVLAYLERETKRRVEIKSDSA
jgi:phage terminase large subunit GpA-like protein